ncbi:MAG TPA: AmmeMemoRadiSam system protein B [Spirochaetota bacterium]|nr:AmmeMemoRadiSam system protein B [Spirochaetota bacterium]
MKYRKPAVAGSFYPGNPSALSKMIGAYLDDAAKDAHSVEGRICGVISPHAGYIYSGPVAAYGYRLLEGKSFDGFAVFAPSHRGRFKGASVMPEGYYSTPLGDVEIDSDVAGIILEDEFFGYLKDIDELEHSLEVQVPFLQTVAHNFRIVPVVMGTTDTGLCEDMGETVARAIISSGKNYCIIISTDLSHYHSYEKAVSMDSKFIEAVSSFDTKKIHEVVNSGSAEACGEGAVLAGLAACRMLGAEQVQVLKYMNSGDTAGPKDQVVGYMSAVLTGKAG